MSIRYQILESEDIELSEDGKEIEVLFKSDRNGNNYVDIPVDFVKGLLGGAAQGPSSADGSTGDSRDERGDSKNVVGTKSFQADSYFEGQCGCCQIKGQVRYKNLYATGSEGIYLCNDCERALLHVLNEMKFRAIKMKKQLRMGGATFFDA